MSRIAMRTLKRRAPGCLLTQACTPPAWSTSLRQRRRPQLPLAAPAPARAALRASSCSTSPALALALLNSDRRGGFQRGGLGPSGGMQGWRVKMADLQFRLPPHFQCKCRQLSLRPPSGWLDAAPWTAFRVSAARPVPAAAHLGRPPPGRQGTRLTACAASVVPGNRSPTIFYIFLLSPSSRLHSCH